jgi:hypothetical protein
MLSEKGEIFSFYLESTTYGTVRPGEVFWIAPGMGLILGFLGVRWYGRYLFRVIYVEYEFRGGGTRYGPGTCPTD